MSYTEAQAQAYTAEHAIWSVLDNVAASEEAFTVTVAGSSLVIPLERKFGRIEDIQSYVDRVWQVVNRNMGSAPRVRPRQSIRHAHASRSRNEIAIPTNEVQAAGKSGWAMREIVVLHELAHILNTSGDHSDGGHGPAFVGWFLRLIREVMGYETWLLALSTFDHAGVDIDFGV